MTTIAREQITSIPAAGRIERPVFVSDGDQRARLLRLTAVVVVVLAALWVAGLVVGMLGLGRLPGIPLPMQRAGGSSPAGDVRPAGHGVVDVAPVQLRNVQTTRGPASITRGAAPGSTRSAERARVAKTVRAAAPTRRAAPTAAPPAAVSPTAPPATQPIQRGWVRRGWSAPPGRSQPIEPKPRPETRGQIRRTENPGKADATATPADATTPPVPPGQEKKSEQPPTTS